MTMEKNNDFFWLVGFVEGEGCFSLSNGKYARIMVGCTDKDVVDKASNILGGPKVTSSTRKRKDGGVYKTLYSIVICGIKAVNLMLEFRGFMGERRKSKIDYILSKCVKTKRQSFYADHPEMFVSN